MTSTYCAAKVFLPVEVILNIFQYLGASDLSHCSLVSQQWRLLSNTETLWFNLCKETWKDKKFSLKIQANADFSGDCVHRLDPTEIEQILSSRELSQPFFFKNNGCPFELIQSTTPKQTKSLGKFQSKWKSSYAFAQWDSQRAILTLDDIYGEWLLNSGPRQRCEPVRAWFYEDLTYDSGNTGSIDWELVDNFVHIQHFPPLEGVRTADWGWKLSCPYFSFYKEL
ncbi:F-box and WD repeat domain containing 8 [Basidiobolus ranarum]|uniref:F-box and WD repeat domain containing 8 n=1 Tax=Basidiobolus ranarum TaxID=34480 RepID=A0ABR2WVM4_9FUNG